MYYYILVGSKRGYHLSNLVGSKLEAQKNRAIYGSISTSGVLSSQMKISCPFCTLILRVTDTTLVLEQAFVNRIIVE
jgi:hypothetical protein